MALIDRLAHDEGMAEIASHSFSAALWFWTKGDITRTNVVDAFALDVTDRVQLDQLQTHYVGLSATGKATFHSDIEAAGILLETRNITKAKYKSLMGLT